MVAGRRLPGGRGYRTGPDAKTNQGESYDIRREQLSEYDGLILSPRNWWGPLVASGTPGANYLRLIPIQPQPSGFKLVQARIFISNASAGSFYKSALFLYNKTKNSFDQIPGSEAVFPADSAATVVSKNLPFDVTIEPNTLVYLAVMNSGGIATVACCDNGVSAGVSGVINCWKIQLANFTMPNTLSKSILTADTGGAIYAVAYVSNRGKNIV